MGGFTNMIIPAMKKWEFIPSYGDRMRFLWGIASGNLLQFAIEHTTFSSLIYLFKMAISSSQTLSLPETTKGLCSLLDLQMDDGTNT